MTKFKLQFERIGRNHAIGAREFEARDADHLAEQVYDLARRHMVSRDLDVSLNLEEGNGNIYAGFHSAGTFTIEEVAA
jgi:hypothetical protein